MQRVAAFFICLLGVAPLLVVRTDASCAQLVQAVPAGAGLAQREHCNALLGNIQTHKSHLSQITNMFLGYNFEYMQLAAHFSRDTINWDGFSAYFQALSDEAWENAIKLVKYANVRGLNLGSDLKVKMPANRRFDKSENEALGFALDRERTALGSIVYLLKNSAGVNSGADNAAIVEPLLNDFIESKFAAEGVETVREIAGLVHNFHAMSGSEEYPMAVFHMNKVLKKLAES